VKRTYLLHNAVSMIEVSNGSARKTLLRKSRDCELCASEQRREVAVCEDFWLEAHLNPQAVPKRGGGELVLDVGANGFEQPQLDQGMGRQP
jgi:hypothetical protein